MNTKLTYYPVKEIDNILLHGRMDTSLNVVPMLSNGSGIEVNVTGSELWADIEADYTDYEPWVAIELNGELISRFMLDRGRREICLFRGIDPSRITRVKFYRELQAMSEDLKTAVVIRGLRGNGSFMTPPSYDHRLEFIGDSITSGEGTYGARSDEDWAAYCMSYSGTYANLICKELNAESRIISQGGWGIFSGWDNDRRHNVPRHYETICGLNSGGENDKYGASRPYDFSSWIPDAIIINLGTNDNSGFNQPPFTDPDNGAVYKLSLNPDGSHIKEDDLLIGNAAIDFLKLIRKNNPSPHILWVYGMLGYDLTPVIVDAIERYKLETNDKNIRFLQLPSANSDTLGSREHPGLKSHMIAAGVISDYLKTYFNSQPLS